ncbi:MAG: PEP-CTERM sorting domain-containing protein [Verrucomicrobiota bacterium]|nr:PEP-CTERM sorting domain-containing protein [Verrucomicrobiota bacterium]
MKLKLKYLGSVVTVMLSIGAPVALGGVVAVDFGADYTPANINATKVLNIDATVDADFDGTADDRAGSIVFGTVFTPPNSANWTTPASKSGSVIKFGVSVANINSSVDPVDLNISRISSTDIIQSMNGAGTAAMRMATAWYWEKASFLNGADATANLGFSDETASLSAYFNNGGTPTTGFVRSGHFLVQNGSDWYISADQWVSTGGALSINAATADWYVFDPQADTLFWDRDDMGTAVAGSTLADITAMGLYVQHELDDGTAVNAMQQGFSSFQATVIPEPATISIMGFGALAAWIARRLQI